MIRVIIFDAHGVILNGKRFSTVLEKKHGIPFSQTLHVLKAAIEHIISGNPNAAAEVEAYIHRYGWERKAEEFAKYWFATEQYVDKELITYVMKLRHLGITCCLATNQDNYKTKFMKERMGLSLAFDKIFSAGEIGYKKPDPRFFHAMMESFVGLSKEEVLYWDDTELTVKAAKDFGFHAEVYRDFKRFTEKMETYIPQLHLRDDLSEIDVKEAEKTIEKIIT